MILCGGLVVSIGEKRFLGGGDFWLKNGGDLM